KAPKKDTIFSNAISINNAILIDNATSTDDATLTDDTTSIDDLIFNTEFNNNYIKVQSNMANNVYQQVMTEFSNEQIS
ncbi:17905_t:CDS:2, partial [Cetraspora pellucida]